MIVFVEQNQYAVRANLISQTFTTRKKVFVDEMKWDIPVTNGQEVDKYDQLGAAYVILTDDERRNAYASLRLLPSTGPTLLYDVFSKTIPDGAALSAPGIFECTRFCVDEELDAKRTYYRHIPAASLLLLGLCEIGLEKGITTIAANFDPLMRRVYHRAGCEVDVLGEASIYGRRPVACGTFEVSDRILTQMRSKLGIEQGIYEASAAMDFARVASI